MPARFSCADLISRVRFLSGASDAASWSDDQIQAVLDRRRAFLDGYSCVEPGQVTWQTIGEPPPVDVDTTGLVWLSPRVGEWENTVTATSSGASVTLATSDLAAGRFTVTTPLNELVLTGITYDTYNAAADVVDGMLAQLGASFDFSVDQQSFKRSQGPIALRSLSNDLRERAALAGYGSVFGDESMGVKLVDISRQDEWPRMPFEGSRWEDAADWGYPWGY